jgi:hypothetical protein
VLLSIWSTFEPNSRRLAILHSFETLHARMLQVLMWFADVPRFGVARPLHCLCEAVIGALRAVV